MRREAPTGRAPRQRAARFTRHAARLALVCAVAASGALGAAGAFAQDASARAGSDSGRRIRFLYKNTPLERIIEDYARESGERFVIGSPPRARMTIAVKEPVTLVQARALLDAALLYAGFALVPGPEGFWKIVEAKRPPTGAPIVGSPGARNFTPALTLAKVEHAPFAAVAAAVNSLIGGDSLVLGLPDTQTMILASNEAQLHRLLGVIDALDQGATARLLVRRLRHASATTAEPIVRQALGLDDPIRPATGFKLLADARLNALIAIGRASELAEAGAVIDEIDVRLEGSGSVQVVRVQHREADEMADRLQAAFASTGGARGGGASGFGDFQIAVDGASSSLVLSGRPSTLRAVRNLIEELDQPTPQVLLEFTIYEISSSEAFELGTAAIGGVELGGTALLIESTSAGVGGAGGFASSGRRLFELRDLLPETTFGTNPDGSSVASRFQLIASAGDARVETLQRPRLLAASGSEHRLSVGANIPIPVQGTEAATPATTDGTGVIVTSPLQIRTTIERQDIGVEVRVTPTLGAAGGVDLELTLDVTGVLDETNAESVGSNAEVGPTLTQRRLDTRLWLPDGGAALLGSVPQRNVNRTERGIPFLRHIPVLGWPFRTRSGDVIHREIVFAVQSWVVRTPEERLADSVRLRLGFERALDRAPLSNERARFGVRVATLEREDDATSVRDAVAPLVDGAVRIEAWDFHGERLWDVIALDFASIGDAAESAAALAEEGWRSEIVALPAKQRSQRERAAAAAAIRSGPVP